jgi:NTE family protein
MALYATGLLIGQRLSRDVAALPPGTDVRLLPPPCPLTVQPTDFSHAAELIELGRESAVRYLDSRRARRRSERPRRRGSHPIPDARRTRR